MKKTSKYKSMEIMALREGKELTHGDKRRENWTNHKTDRQTNRQKGRIKD